MVTIPRVMRRDFRQSAADGVSDFGAAENIEGLVGDLVRVSVKDKIVTGSDVSSSKLICESEAEMSGRTWTWSWSTSRRRALSRKGDQDTVHGLRGATR